MSAEWEDAKGAKRVQVEPEAATGTASRFTWPTFTVLGGHDNFLPMLAREDKKKGRRKNALTFFEAAIRSWQLAKEEFVSFRKI